MRRLGAIMLILLLAGCNGAPEPTPSLTPSPPPGPSPTPTPSAGATVPRLDVALKVVDRWVRPEDRVEANATARATLYEWYLAPRNPLWRVPDAGPFFIASESARDLNVREVGRHGFALEEGAAHLGVSIIPDALPLRLEASLLDEGDSVLFAPDELVGGPGSVLTLTNHLTVPARILPIERMIPLAENTSSISFLKPDHVEELGDYDLVVVARDGAGAVGETRARIVYDNRKPDPSHTFGPFTGRFQAPPLPTAPDPDGTSGRTRILCIFST
jgi:hypothetical protein